MLGLRELLNTWPVRDAVRGAAIVGDDGLVIHDALNPGTDAEAIAALAVTTRRHAEQLGGATGGGPFGAAVFEFGSGPAILSPLPAGATLVVLAAPDRDLGPLLYEVRTRREHLAALL